MRGLRRARRARTRRIPCGCVLSAPPGSAGSSTSTASLRRASVSTSARDVSLPVSSSVVQSMTTRASAGGASANSARVASMPSEMPAFMSRMPGPTRRSPSSAQRHPLELSDTARPCRSDRAAGPDAVRCRTPRADDRRPSATRSRVTRAPSAVRRAASSAPQRSTAALSSVGDSRRDERLDGVEEPVVRSAWQKSRSRAASAIIGGFYNNFAMRSDELRRFALVRAIACALACRRWLRSRRRQPFPQPSADAAAAGAGQPAPPPPPPATTRAARPAAAGAPTEAMLGVPIYPSAQFITSYDAGRGQRFYLFGVGAPFAEMVHVLPHRAEEQGRRAVRVAADAPVRDRPLPRRDDGVSAERDDQGLHVGRIGRLSESEARRAARALPDHHSDRARAAGFRSVSEHAIVIQRQPDQHVRLRELRRLAFEILRRHRARVARHP